MAGTKQPDAVRVILKCNGEEHICKHMPTGWREHSTGWTFDFDGFGYNKKYSIDTLRFVLQDADFIRHCMDLYGISAEIDIIVQRRNQRWTYDDFFTGQIDIGKGYTNEVDFVEVDVYEGGFKRALGKDNKTNFDIPFDGDAVDIQVPEGMKFFEQVKYIINTVPTEFSLVGETLEVWNAPQFFLESDSFVYTPNLKFNTQDNHIIALSPINSTFFLEVIKNEQIPDFSITAVIEVFLNIKNLAGTQFNYLDFTITDFRSNDLDNPIRYTIATIPQSEFTRNSDGKYDGMFNFSKKFNITISKNFTSNFLFKIGGNFTYDKINLFNGSIVIKYFGNVNTGSFNFKAYKAEKFGQKLLDKIHAGAIFDVPFLQAMETNENMQLFITSADAIRGIKVTDDNPQGALIKTSLVDFVKNIRYLYDFGMQVDNTGNGVYTLKPKNEIFTDTEILDLGEVIKMQTVMPDEEWFANNIQIGYEKQEYDYPLGRQEFAVTLEFNSDLKVVNKKSEMVSDYRADYTGVHLLHYDYVNSDKKDSKSDNDLFWILAFRKQVQINHNVVYNKTVPLTMSVSSIAVSVGQSVQQGQALMRIKINNSDPLIEYFIYAEWAGVITSINVSVGQTLDIGTNFLCTLLETQYQWQAIKGDRITAINGMEGGGYFNILLSPKTMLINHTAFFASILDKHEKILRYTSSTETMSALEYTDTELGQVTEKAGLSVAGAVPFFKPLVFMFDCIIKHNLPEILGQNPAGYLKFRYNNLELKGFPLEIEGSTNDSVQTVKCIAHPDTPDNIQEILHKRLPNKLYK